MTSRPTPIVILGLSQSWRGERFFLQHQAISIVTKMDGVFQLSFNSKLTTSADSRRCCSPIGTRMSTAGPARNYITNRGIRIVDPLMLVY